VVFLDPPYDAAEEYAATLGLLGGAACGIAGGRALVIAEHRKKERLEERYGECSARGCWSRGMRRLSFYAAAGWPRLKG
jgi:16S rRNA (guanine966-N2)-methyltransferase